MFWNKFETDFQQEGKMIYSSKMSSTPVSGKRKRRAISPIPVDQASPTPKTKRAKRNLNFNEKTEKEEASSQEKNVLNLPYSDYEDEEE